MRVYKCLEKTVLNISIGLFCIIFTCVTFQLLCRNLIGRSFGAIEETVILLMPFFGFSCATYTLFCGNHVQIDFVYKKLPLRLRKAIFFLTQIALLALTVFVAYTGWGLSFSLLKAQTEVLKIPYGVQYMAFPVSAFFMVAPYIYNVCALFANKLDEFAQEDADSKKTLRSGLHT